MYKELYTLKLSQDIDSYATVIFLLLKLFGNQYEYKGITERSTT